MIRSTPPTSTASSTMSEYIHEPEAASTITSEEPMATTTTPSSSRRRWIPRRRSQSPHPTKLLHDRHAQVHPPSWLQRFRRNHVLGPIAFSMLVIVVMPSMLGASTSRELPPLPTMEQALPRAWRWRLPLVAAVPFLRFGKHRSSSTSRSSAMATAVDVEPETNVTTTAAPTVVGRRSKRSNSHNNFDYYFPLLSPQELEQYQLGDLPQAVDRYVTAHGHNEAKARQAFDATLEWRNQQEIDAILSRPNPKYDAVKAVIPHYFIGRDVQGHVVFVQRPGYTDPDLAKRNNLVLDDLLLQYAYVFEYCWNVLHPNDSNALMTGIIDLQGINLSLLRKRELLGFVKTFVAMIDAHYPSRAYQTYMINAPKWFYTLYKVISPIMRESTKEKITITSAGDQQTKTLQKALGTQQANLVLRALSSSSVEEDTNDTSGENNDTESTESDSEQPPPKKKRTWGILPRKSKSKADTTAQESSTTRSGASGGDLLLATDMEQEIRNFVLAKLDKEGIPMQKVVP